MLSQREKEFLGVRKAFQSAVTEDIFHEIQRRNPVQEKIRPSMREGLFWTVNDLCMKGMDEEASNSFCDLHLFGTLKGSEPSHLLGVAARGGCLRTAADIMDRYDCDLSESVVKGRILTAARRGHAAVALEMIDRFECAKGPAFLAHAAQIAGQYGHPDAARALRAVSA